MEAYAVAVRVSLINGAASGLMALARQFKATHVSAMQLKKELKGIELLMLGGGMAAATGFFGLHLIGKTLPYAKEYTNQLSLMNTLGMRQADIAKVVGQAWKTSLEVPTTTTAENLKSFRELRSVFGTGHESEAASMLPVVGRLQGILTALTGHEQERVGFDLVKAIELRQQGVMSQAFLQKNAELMSRTLIGMGGTLTVGDFHGAMKMGKSNTSTWSDDFTYNYLPTLMQELKTGRGGAQSAGTYLSTFSRAIHGHMQKSAFPYWIQSGLVSSRDVVKNATGQWQMRPGSVHGTELFESSPYLWVQKYLQPAVSKIMGRDHISEKTAIDAMFSDRNASFTAFNMLTKARQYERDKQTINQADSMGAYNKLLKTNPELAQLALQKQWQNLLAQLGFTIMPQLISGMRILMEVVQSMTRFTRNHPTATRGLMLGAAGFSGFLAIGGTIMMAAGALKALGLAVRVIGLGAAIAASPIALIVLGIGAMGVALYAIATHWDRTKGVFANIKAELGMFWDFLRGLPGKLFDLLPGWAKAGVAAAGFTPPPGHAAVPVIHVHNKIDQHGLTTAVTTGQSRSMGRAGFAGTSTHDVTMSPPIPGLAFHGGN